MKRWLIAGFLLLVVSAGAGGYWWSRNRLLPVPLAPDASLFVAPNTDPGQEKAKLEMLLPPGKGLHDFMLHQVGEPLILPSAEGGWTGVLAGALWASPNHRHWRLRLRQALWLHDGHLMDARWAIQALHIFPDGPFVAGARASVVDDRTFDLDFKQPWDLLGHLANPDAVLTIGSGSQAIGSGPFRFAVSSGGGTFLERFDGYRHGNAGIAELHLPEDPALMDGHRWAQDLVAGRYALAVFPGNVPPDDMAMVRNAPYDQLRLKDGSVWFISRRMRRLHPDDADWTRTSIYGAWRADMDLPYDPR